MSYDTFEKAIIAVITIVTVLGLYYAWNILKMAQEQVYESTVLLNVLLFILVEGMLLNSVLLYTLLKRGEKRADKNR